MDWPGDDRAGSRGGGIARGLPIYRKHAAIRQLEKVAANFKTENGRPDWLRRCLGDKRMKLFDDVVAVSGLTMESSGTNHHFLSNLTALRSLQFDVGASCHPSCCDRWTSGNVCSDCGNDG